MKKKIVAIIILMLMITTAAPIVTAQNNDIIRTTEKNNIAKSCASGGWIEKEKLIEPAPSVWSDSLCVSVSGDTSLIGDARNHDSGLMDSGAAFFFTRTMTGTIQQEVIAPDVVVNLNFGFSVAIDGNTAFIGAIYENHEAGSVYVYTRTGNTWSYKDELYSPTPNDHDFFGWSVALDGDTAVIGAVWDDDSGTDSGAAFIYTYNTGTGKWGFTQQLLPSGLQGNDQFGFAVALDGNTALVSAWQDNDNGDFSGSAYVFIFSAGTWIQQGNKLLAPDGAAYDDFGRSVSISGNMALVGAFGDDDQGDGSGSAYAFIRNGNTWSFQHKFLAPGGVADDLFGVSVSIDGNTALIGAHHNGAAGSAYVFVYSPPTGVWTFWQKLVASNPTGGAYFGYSVSLDGDTALIGAPGVVTGYVFTIDYPLSTKFIFGVYANKINGWTYMTIQAGAFLVSPGGGLYTSGMTLKFSKTTFIGYLGSIVIIGFAQVV